MLIQRFMELRPIMRTGDALLFRSDGSWMLPDTVVVPATIRKVIGSEWSHIALIKANRLIDRPNWQKDGGPPEMWASYDTPRIMKEAKKTWVEIFHASKHGGVRKELASIVLERHKGQVAWIPMDHDKVREINPNYQSILSAIAMRNNGLDYNKTDLARYFKVLRPFFSAQLEQFSCSRCFASSLLECSLPVNPRATPPECIRSGPYIEDKAEILSADYHGKFRLFYGE